MKFYLDKSQALYGAQIDQVPPGVRSKMDGMGSNINYVQHKVDMHESQMADMRTSMPCDFREVLNSFGKML